MSGQPGRDRRRRATTFSVRIRSLRKQYSRSPNTNEFFFRFLTRAPHLRKLNLSNNRRITIKSHAYLSELKTLRELYLSGCALLSGSHQLSLALDKLTLSSEASIDGFVEAPYGYLTTSTRLPSGD